MSKEILIIIEDRLEVCEPVLNAIPQTAPFLVEIMGYEQLLSSEAPRILLEALPEEVFIALDGELYLEQRKELEAFFSGLFDISFKNFLPLFTGYKKELPEKPCFIFAETADANSNALYFVTTMVSLFANLQTSRRLNQYIADSFKGVVVTELLSQKNKEIRQLNDELEYKNKIDSLTRLYNRRGIYDFLEGEKKRALRQLQRFIWNKEENQHFKTHIGYFSIILIDIDDFKRVNDTYGHLIGDNVLMSLGNWIRTSGFLRENDVAGRIGGEEFIILLPETRARDAKIPAQRLLTGFSELTFKSKKYTSFHVTLSAGISEFYPRDMDIEELVKRADCALYKAKAEGKNRIIVYEPHLKGNST